MNEEIQLEQRAVPLIPLRVASVFANKEKEDFDDGDISVLDKYKPVRLLSSPFKPEAVGSIPDLASLSDETLNEAPSPHNLSCCVGKKTLLCSSCSS